MCYCIRVLYFVYENDLRVIQESMICNKVILLCYMVCCHDEILTVSVLPD